METQTEHTATPGPLTSECRLIGETDRKGYRLLSWRRPDGDYFAEVRRAGDSLFQTGDDPNRGAADLEAERWIDRKVGEGPVEVSGWSIAVHADRGGTFKAELVDAQTSATPEDAPTDFRGYLSREQLLAEAKAWAEQHPRGGVGPPASEEPAADEPRDGEGGAAVLEQSTAPDTTAPAEPEAQSPEPPATVAPAELSPSTPEPALPPVFAIDLDEASELAREWTELSIEIGALEDELKALKDELKAKNSKRDLLAGKLARGVTALRAGRAPPAYQTRLPLPGPSPVVDVGAGKGGAEAQAVADRLKPGEERWTANAVELTLTVHEFEPGRWVARVQQLPEAEGFGDSRDDAVKACKGRAEIYLADCPPGSTVRAPDAGPVADGPPKPPKRGRKPKLKGHTLDEVQAALRGAMNLDEAARALKVSVAELEAYAGKAEFALSEHLGRDTGKDEPAPRKGRGRGRKAGAK